MSQWTFLFFLSGNGAGGQNGWVIVKDNALSASVKRSRDDHSFEGSMSKMEQNNAESKICCVRRPFMVQSAGMR